MLQTASESLHKWVKYGEKKTGQSLTPPPSAHLCVFFVKYLQLNIIDFTWIIWILQRGVNGVENEYVKGGGGLRVGLEEISCM